MCIYFRWWRSCWVCVAQKSQCFCFGWLTKLLKCFDYFVMSACALIVPGEESDEIWVFYNEKDKIWQVWVHRWVRVAIGCPALLSSPPLQPVQPVGPSQPYSLFFLSPAIVTSIFQSSRKLFAHKYLWRHSCRIFRSSAGDLVQADASPINHFRSMFYKVRW